MKRKIEVGGNEYVVNLHTEGKDHRTGNPTSIHGNVQVGPHSSIPLPPRDWTEFSEDVLIQEARSKIIDIGNMKQGELL